MNDNTSGPHKSTNKPNHYIIRPVESQLGPWGYKKNTGPCVGVAAQGQEGATTNANQFRTLIKHWYSRMQPSIGTNLTSKEVLRELMNEHSTDGF